MSHEFLQEIYEKEKRKLDALPNILNRSGVSSYVSKRKLTQQTDKLFKSINYSNKKPGDFKDVELLSIKSKHSHSKTLATKENEKNLVRMRKICYVKDPQSFTEAKKIEKNLENPFQTSYGSEYKNTGKIKWIPKRYGSNNNNNHNFSQNFYNIEKNNNGCENTIDEFFVSENDASEKNNKKLIDDEKKFEMNEININEDDQITKIINISPSENDGLKNDALVYSDLKENCICDETKQSEIEEESKNLKTALTKTEYFKILNIGYQHLKTYKLPLEKLNEIVKENIDYFKHLGGLCKCYKCTCGLHKCDCQFLKFNYGFNGQSAYKEDYCQKSISLYSASPYKTENIKKFVSDLKSPQQTDFVKESTAKSDFQNPNSVYQKPVIHYQSIEESPLFYKQSHYQREFLNYGASPFTQTKVQQQKTVIGELPFFGTTTYNQNFISYNGKNPRIDFNFPSIPNPLKNNISPMLDTTTHQREFKAYSISPEKKFKLAEESLVGRIPIPGQYRTTFSKDFMTLKRNVCPVASTNS